MTLFQYFYVVFVCNKISSYFVVETTIPPEVKIIVTPSDPLCHLFLKEIALRFATVPMMCANYVSPHPITCKSAVNMDVANLFTGHVKSDFLDLKVEVGIDPGIFC